MLFLSLRKQTQPLSLFLLLGSILLPCLAGDGPVVRLSRSPEGERRLTIEVPTFRWENGTGGFYPVIEGFGSLSRPGADLPARRERVALAAGESLQIKKIEVEWEEGVLPGPLSAWPARSPSAESLNPEAMEQGWWPLSPAEILTTDGAFRSLRFAEILITPIQVDPAAQRFRWARKITVEFEGLAVQKSLARVIGSSQPDPLLQTLAPELIQGAAEVLSQGGAEYIPEPSPASARALAAAPDFPAWQFIVDRDGLFRITGAWAQANAPGLYDFLRNNDPSKFQLTVQGVEVPILVQGLTGGVFGTGSSITFFGQAVGRVDLFSPDDWQAGDFTDNNVYRLGLAANPARIASDTFVGAAPAAGHPTQPSFRETVHGEKDTRFLGFIPNNQTDHWYSFFLGAYDSKPAQSDEMIDTPGHAGGAVNLRLRLLSSMYKDPLHRTAVDVDGIQRDSADWDGFREFTHGVENGVVSFTPAAPLSASTRITLRLPLGRGVTTDKVFFNWTELDYDRQFRAVGNQLAFRGDNTAREIQLRDFTELPEVWELTEKVISPAGMAVPLPKRVATVQSSCSGNPCFSLDQDSSRPALREFAAAAGSGFLVPKEVRQDLPPSQTDATLGTSLKGPGLGADWILLAPQALLDLTPGHPLKNLVAQRSHDFRTAVVALEDVYDDFSFGIEDPEAIRQFAAWTFANWNPKPSYLFLVGDGTRDYKNAYRHTPRRQFLPPFMISVAGDPQFQYYLSDIYFTKIAGNDDLPDILVGRVPAHNLDEANEYFRKVVAYETASDPNGFPGNAMLVSDNDPQYGFREAHQRIRDRYFASGPQTANSINMSTMPDCETAASDTRTKIQNGVNSGAAVLSYLGHGGFQSWGGGWAGCPATFFDTHNPETDDQEPLHNGQKLQFHIHAACITGHFAQDTEPAPNAIELQYTFLEDWVTTPGKSAVGGIAASYLSYSFMVEPILDAFYGSLYGKHKVRIAGALDLAVRKTIFDLNARDEGRGYVLEADPALKLVVPAPAAPQLTQVEQAGSGALRVGWTSVLGAVKYRLYRSSYWSGGYTLVKETNQLEVVDTGLQNCREYFYYVVSVDASGFESAWSNFNDTCGGDRSDCRSGIPHDPDPPPAPLADSVIVSDTQSGGQLQVTWSTANQGPDVIQYRVQWGTAAGGPFDREVVVLAPGSSTLIGGLEDRKTYYFVVRAEHCSAIGPASSPAKPGVPHTVRGLNPPDGITDLRVRRLNSKDLELTWSVPIQTAWGVPVSTNAVDVYGDKNNPIFPLDNGRRLVRLVPPQVLTRWVDTNAAGDSQSRYYLVVARDPSGLGSAPGAEYPAGIADLRISQPVGGYVDLVWSPVQKDLDGGPVAVKGYNLYGQTSAFTRAQCSAANRIRTGLPQASSHEPLPAGNFFAWQVLAEDYHGGESIW